MHLILTRDDNLAAVGFAALLQTAAAGADLSVTLRIHVITAGLPYTADQHLRVSGLAGHQADACIVLESLREHPERALLRVCRNNVYMINARLPLAGMHLLAGYILQRLSQSLPRVQCWRDEIYHRFPHLPRCTLSRPDLSREECCTLSYLLAGWSTTRLATLTNRSTKTISGYRRGLRLRLNAFSPAGLHMRLCMECGIMQPAVRVLYSVSLTDAGDGEGPGRQVRLAQVRRRLHRLLESRGYGDDIRCAVCGRYDCGCRDGHDTPEHQGRSPGSTP